MLADELWEKHNIYSVMHKVYFLAAIKEAMEAVREKAAAKAGHAHSIYQDTKTAHEMLSKEPFKPSAFGFDMEVVNQSAHLSAAIRQMELP